MKIGGVNGGIDNRVGILAHHDGSGITDSMHCSKPYGIRVTWIPLDAGFKQYTYSEVLDLKTAITGFDPQAFIDLAIQAAVVDENTSSITSFDYFSTPASLQVKLLRVLEDKKVRKLGSIEKEGKIIDVKIIAATNNLLNLRSGKFRQDLLNRLKTFFINIPPLMITLILY